MCPRPGRAGICVTECGPVNKCRDGKVCCFNGCAYTCVDPGNNSYFLLVVMAKLLAVTSIMIGE